jgi:hypothetical protein
MPCALGAAIPICHCGGVEYNLESLSWRQFEQMAQALTIKVMGPGVAIFGDGPDGGREASWTGDYPSLGNYERWQGYGVLQAKMHLHPLGVAQNLSWLSTQIRSELDDWVKPKSKRGKKPDFLLFATNVRISPSGKDRIRKTIRDHAESINLNLLDFAVWDYDDFRGMLDGDADVRAAYASLITPGDLISRLLDKSKEEEANFADALILHAASDFDDDTHVKLSQTGTYGDRRIAIADVFVDLPLEEPLNVGNQASAHDPDLEETNVIAGLINRFDFLTTASDTDHSLGKRCVLVGGPGQGKSTVTQYLAQIYRASFIADTSVGLDQDLLPHIARVIDRAKSIGIPLPKARRWPFRIDLTHLADALASKQAQGILEYITNAISKSSERSINIDRVHEWLSAFPWLLILDGLDEVPNSSNREQVMKAVRDFGLKSAAVGGDVTILATTRPQGYSEEFDPKFYTHIELAPLPLDVALDYARGFISVRMVEGSTRAESVYQGLVKASTDESTAKLFSSPLQVTILTVLIETSGQVPKDRWKLFLRYYDVINQRELEKGGELSDLLQDYEPDVVYLHRHIGNLLQRRSAGVGDTSATISRDEFTEIIRARLNDMDHEPSKVAFLTQEFIRLVTDRLVFLAVVSSDKIGFEIRSLQEFMAGAYISDLPDTEIIPTIRELAPVPYWRNVILFAIGYIFTSKEYLKAEIPQLCDELDEDAVDGSFLKQGSLLALDILLDGSAQSQPRFSKKLARRAASLLEGPVQHRAEEFTRFSDDVVAPILRDAALLLTPTTSSGWINRTNVSSALIQEPATRAAHVQSIFALAEDSAREGILQSAADRDDAFVLEALKEELGAYSPSLILGNLRRNPWRAQRYEDENVQDWLKSLVQALRNGGRMISMSLEGSAGTRFNLSYNTIDSMQEEWAAIADLKYPHPGWRFLSAIGSFVQSPSNETLNGAILAMKGLSPAERLFAESAPWVIAACYEAACKYPSPFAPTSTDDALDYLSSECMAGGLGTADDWLAIENRYDGMKIDVANQVIGRPGLDEPQASLPIWPELATEGLSLLGASMSIVRMQPNSEGDSVSRVSELEQMVRLAKTVHGISQRASIVNYASFVGTISLDNFDFMGDPQLSNDPSWESFSAFLEEECMSLPDDSELWGRWALTSAMKNMQREDYPLILEKLGGMELYDGRFGGSVDNMKWVTNGATYSPTGWRRYRLALTYAPDMLHTLEDFERFYILSKAGESTSAAVLARLVRLTGASNAELRSGDMDEDIRALFNEHVSGVGRALDQVWVAVVTAKHRSIDLVRSIVRIAVDEKPYLAIRFIEHLAPAAVEDSE